jgi:hypothetical protein
MGQSFLAREPLRFLFGVILNLETVFAFRGNRFVGPHFDREGVCG